MTTIDSADTPVFPPGRYGRRRAPRRHPRWLMAVLVGLVVATAAAVTMRLYQQYGDLAYDVDVRRITDVTDAGATVEFAVRVPPGGAARCTVRARSYDGVEVGRASAEVRAAPGERTVVATHRLTTSARPYTAEVLGCGPAGNQ